MSPRPPSPQDRFLDHLLTTVLPAVVRCCWGRLWNEVDVEDAANETLWRIYHRYSTDEDHIKTPGHYTPTYLRVARNVCLEIARAHCKWPTHLNETADADIISSDRGPLDGMLDREQDAVVAEAMARLAPVHRHVLTLHHCEGMKIPEIAAALDRPEGTVKSLLHRAREELRGLLGPTMTECHSTVGESR